MVGSPRSPAMFMSRSSNRDWKFQNTIQAFMWPVSIIETASPWGAIGLGLAFLLFPRYVKKHIEAWLFVDGDRDEGAEIEEK